MVSSDGLDVTRPLIGSGIPEEAFEFVGVALYGAVGFALYLQDNKKLSIACLIVIAFLLDIGDLLLLV
jgi:hypothetical protein